MTGRRRGRGPASEAGLTLAELIVAIAILTIAIVGVGAALTVQSGGLARGSTVGLAAVTRANLVATAAMLAQQRLEEIRNARYIQQGTTVTDEITGANFPDEGYNSIAGFPNFRREVRIQDNTPGTNAKTVTVEVFFKPLTESGQGAEERVRLVTIIALRRIS